MNTSNRLIFIVSAALMFALALPLFIADLKEEALIVFSLVCLYLFITVQLDLLIRVAKALKWTKTGVLLVGFFGIKNVFFVFYFVFLFLAEMINSNLSVLLIPLLYFVFSFLIGKKLLKLEDGDFEGINS